MKILFLTLASAGLLATGNAGAHIPEGPFTHKAARESQVTYQVDADRSQFNWQARKVTGEHSGTVNIASGFVHYNKGMLVGGQFEMDMRTIANTDIQSEGTRNRLENHLRSEDFFSVEKYPKATFKVKVWAPIPNAKEGASNYYVKGDLTIKGITKEITFPARVELDEQTFEARAEFDIDRTEFDIRYRSGKYFPDIGDKMIDDLFKVQIELLATAQPNR
jgi:polyisoprenoid-binding protein YceI